MTPEQVILFRRRALTVLWGLKRFVHRYVIWPLSWLEAKVDLASAHEITVLRLAAREILGKSFIDFKYSTEWLHGEFDQTVTIIADREKIKRNDTRSRIDLEEAIRHWAIHLCPSVDTLSVVLVLTFYDPVDRAYNCDDKTT